MGKPAIVYFSPSGKFYEIWSVDELERLRLNALKRSPEKSRK
jgi:hypothetical protein